MPYAVEPWRLRETELDLARLGPAESVFALANGHIGLRGNLDEGEPHGLPGTYLNSVYELRPLPYAEAGYGYPEAGQTTINVTNGKLIRLLVDDEPLDVRYGDVRRHERVLDLREGVLTRSVEWSSPSGSTVRITSERLVSFVQRAIAAVRYEVEAVDRPVRLVLQSELVANEEIVGTSGDPRAAAVLKDPLVPEQHQGGGTTALLMHRTRHSGLRVGAAMDHEVNGPDRLEVATETFSSVARTTVLCRLEPGERLTVTKYLSYGWSAQRTLPAVHDQVMAALAGARFTGWEGLRTEQRDYLEDFWHGADVELEGDAEVQQAVRVSLFHVLQAGARAERRPIAGKGLTGTGYDGHTFWDTETFVLPVLTFTAPAAAADALRWRHSILPIALERAETLGLRGAAFPWRTIHGEECSGYWPAGTAAFHINADIADAVVRYVDATDDMDFERDTGLDLLVHTARLWASLGHHDGAGRFHIDGVTGPDEYSAIADDNVYTNLMAQRNLRAAAAACGRHLARAAELGVGDEERAGWRDAAADMHVPYDEEQRVHPQSEGFTGHEVWDFSTTEADEYPLLLHFPYFQLYRLQVVKQADLVLAMQLRGDAFTPEQKARNFAYYEALTVRDSSLSASTQAVIAAEVGHLELAYDYLGEAALMDLDDLEHNTADGLHMASLAGAVTALVAGFGGLRTPDGLLEFAPRLPGALQRLTFRLQWKRRRLCVSIGPTDATYQLLRGEALQVRHHGELLVVPADTPVTRPVPPAPQHPRPRQPPGREPRPRHGLDGRS